jgi:predicted dehydrogenase
MRLLLYGFGSIGQRHHRNFSGLTEADWTVLEPNRNLWRELPRTRFTDQLEDGMWDVALVCTPTHAHAEHALQAASRCKALFIEKPVAHELSRIPELLEATRDIPTMVGCNFRFERGLRAVKSLLDQQAIGKLISVRAEFGQWLPDWRPTADYRLGYATRRELGGGIILDRIHELDYLSWLMGRGVEVKAISGKLSDLEIATEDTAEIVMRFENGVIGSAHLDYVQREYTCTLKIVGQEGSIRWSFKPSHVELLTAATKRWEIRYEETSPDVNVMYVDEAKHFLDCLARGEPPMNGLREAAETLTIVLRAKGEA